MTGERRPSEPEPARPGYVHDALLHDGGVGLVEATLGFATDGLEAGEHVALACSADHNTLLVEAVGDRPRLEVLDRRAIYPRAGSAIDYYQRLAHRAVRGGATGLRIVGEVPFGSDPAAYREWGRFEAVCNHALAALPIWSMCAYDTRRTPAAVLDIARTTHPHLRLGSRRTDNPAYVEPDVYLARVADPALLRIEATRPLLAVDGIGTPRELRDARETLRRTLDDHRPGMARTRLEDLVLAVHEVTANALLHGDPPVTVRLWLHGPDAVFTVEDRGPGFDDPFVGYQRGPTNQGRMGLWATRMLCDEVDFRRDAGTFTVRLQATLRP